mmetsp:Transcript_59283/g.98202  ORF Transcript_59283/g.98202 Transcript_59283/m.98202 type:complete len:221 (-) Transcript_59283:1933-2595(-)
MAALSPRETAGAIATHSATLTGRSIRFGGSSLVIHGELASAPVAGAMPAVAVCTTLPSVDVVCGSLSSISRSPVPPLRSVTPLRSMPTADAFIKSRAPSALPCPCPCNGSIADAPSIKSSTTTSRTTLVLTATSSAPLLTAPPSSTVPSCGLLCGSSVSFCCLLVPAPSSTPSFVSPFSSLKSAGPLVRERSLSAEPAARSAAGSARPATDLPMMARASC